ncbi:MAG: RNA polymerase sigma factor [Steroidobacteraceae bacterium]|nr:RNA polymerase sigma factor [Steroidobacteraceae bacterium]
MNSRDTQATFDSWLRDYAGILHHVANAFATGADRHDLMQELMLALWRAIPAFRAASLPSTFIYRVTHNAALTWKRAARGHQRKLDALHDLQPASIDLAGQPDADAPTEQLELLYSAIRILEPLDRSLVLLQLDAVSYAQIAEIHGLSESNVGVRLNRIKQKLTTIIQEKTS